MTSGRSDLIDLAGEILATTEKAVQFHDGKLLLRVGCHTKTLAEGRAYWTGKSDRREVMAALDYIEAVAKLRGWIETEAKAAAE